MRRLRHRFTACKDLAIEIVLHFLLFLVLNSIARETAFLPFLEHGKHPASLQWYGWPRALPALYLQTYMVYGMMALAMLVHRMVAAVLGLDTLVTFKLPLLLSTSLREFWGRRWNLLIHNLMKRCFFEPFRTGPAWQRYVGGILAFLMFASQSQSSFSSENVSPRLLSCQLVKAVFVMFLREGLESFTSTCG